MKNSTNERNAKVSVGSQHYLEHRRQILSAQALTVSLSGCFIVFLPSSCVSSGGFSSFATLFLEFFLSLLFHLQAFVIYLFNS